MLEALGMTCFICLQDCGPDSLDSIDIFNENTLIYCKGHHSHSICLKRWFTPSTGDISGDRELTCTLCKRLYTKEEREKIVASTKNMESVLLNMKFCRNEDSFSLFADCGVKVPVDFYIESILWAAKTSDLKFMRLLKSFRFQFRHFRIDDNRKITQSVYKSPYQTKYNWLLNDFLSDFLHKNCDTNTLIRECLARHETGTAFNLYVDNFRELSKEDRYGVGYIITKHAFNYHPALRLNGIHYDATEAFKIIGGEKKYADIHCENVRELFIPVMFQFIIEIGGDISRFDDFLYNCIINVEKICRCEDHFQPFFKLCLMNGDSKILADLFRWRERYVCVNNDRIASLDWSPLKVPRQVATSKNPEGMAQVILQTEQLRCKWLWKFVFNLYRNKPLIDK